MILTKSIKVHAVDEKKNQALCGQVKNIDPGNLHEGSYLKVDCKLCQWIIENELTARYGS